MRTGPDSSGNDCGRIRIVLVDDADDYRRLLHHRLSLHDEFVIAGEARDGHEATRLVTELQPDVIVLDLEMPNCDGLTAVPLLRRAAPAARILVLSAFPEPYTLGAMLQQGVDGYLDKVGAWAELAPTIFALCEDRRPSAPCVDA